MNFLSLLAAWTYARALNVPMWDQVEVGSEFVGGSDGCQMMASTSCLREKRGAACGVGGPGNRN